MISKRNDFLQLFPNCTGSALYITPQLLKGAAEETTIHSAIWKFFLVIAPQAPNKAIKSDDWVRILKEKRDEFFKLKQEYIKDAPDDDSIDPLLAKQDSRWDQFFKDQELRRQIRLDTSRAFQDMEFFQNEAILSLIEDILFLFCRTHPNYGYPQGLHELAAYILYVFHSEMIAEDNDVISFIFNSASVVPDAYFTFAALAESIEPLYQASETSKDGSFCSNLANDIQNKLLREQCPELSRVLQQSGILPSSYMLQWLRLLFLRVFDFESIKSMWDIIFAYLPNLNIISYTCVAMLLNAQNKLLNSDSTQILQFLFHYPDLPHPARFVVEAAKIITSKEKKNESVDIITIVSERLNELSGKLNEICIKLGYEEAMPYVMDIRRTRDVLLGILPIEEMLPLEQAVELFRPISVEYQVKENLMEEAISHKNNNEKENNSKLEMVKASSSTSTIVNNNEAKNLLFEIVDDDNNNSTKENENEKNNKSINAKKKNVVHLFDDDVPTPKVQNVNVPGGDLFGKDVKPIKETPLIGRKEPKGLLFEEENIKKKKKGNNKTKKAKLTQAKKPDELFA
ncbi:TBC1 domain family member 5 [Histomonas meleagridis]|uniref:TBC1 domain family member 5 n=1 Tax=Histomonas meleagridis TaxID=135588 RepID=UPI003559BEE3|nr:TBC1 domain family member 5 [Histomonas meleagridis]KAH0803491.1 TBC1 domain family member 5 [Histomonas meleagridis]